MNKKIAASAAALVALGVASGTAFTASNGTLTDKTVGFSTTEVTGATLGSTSFEYDVDGDALTGATLTFTGGADDGDKVLLTFKGASATDSDVTVDGTVTAGTATIGPIADVATAKVSGYSIAVIDGNDTTP